jgi:glycosyltransferase involved in cell wall biosynthesis
LKPLVSILIPAFNAEAWIADTLRSAIAQTWERKEIIVVDDGSTDHTLAVATSFERQGVRVFTQPNAGAAAARNEAYRQSRGDYIQWLDADDLLAPDKISLQLSTQRGSRSLLSSEWGEFLYRYDHARFVPSALWCDLSPTEWLVRKLAYNAHMQTATWLVSRELTDAAGSWNTQLSVDDDGEYFCRVLMASDSVCFVPGATVYYRASGNASLSYIGHSEKKIRAHWQSMLLHIDYTRSLEDSDSVRGACVKYLNNWLIHFYPEYPEIVSEAEQLAVSLGGLLEAPPLSWKYAWVKALFGWSAAKRFQMRARTLRWSVQRSWDRTLFQLDSKQQLRKLSPPLKA